MACRQGGRFGLLAAVSSFGGMLAAIYGSAFLVGSVYASAVLSTGVWLVFAIAIRPALSVYIVITGVARLFRGAERASLAAASALLGGAVGLTGSFLVNGLFLLVGWYLFPWTFAYAGMVLPNLLRWRSAGAGPIALHLAVATAVYAPWIALTLYIAVDTTAEMAGFREGAGWIENFPTAIVLSLLYGIVTIAAVRAMRLPGAGRPRSQVTPSDGAPIQ